MAELRYTNVEGRGQGREYKVAADQYMHRRGGKFIKLVNGRVNVCASGDSMVAGWAVTPKDASGYSAWKSSSTAGEDKIFVIYGLDNIFELPVHEGNASLTASPYIGQGAAVVCATNNSAATSGPAGGYDKIQYAKIAGGTASPLSIVDVDTDNKTAKVRIKPGHLQAMA